MFHNCHGTEVDAFGAMKNRCGHDLAISPLEQKIPEELNIYLEMQIVRDNKIKYLFSLNNLILELWTADCLIFTSITFQVLAIQFIGLELT